MIVAIDNRTTAMGRQVFGQWRPVVQTTTATQSHCNRPTALVGELSPPKPEARSTDLSPILPFYSLHSTVPDPDMESQQPSGLAPETITPEEPRKLIAKIPAAVLATLRSTCAAKAEVSLLGRIHGKHPGLKALTAWARDTLHPSLSFLSLKTNNLFEVTFTHPEGRIHALTQADLVCESAAIFFSSWRPHFDSKAAEESLDFPVWVQIADLCQVLREEPFLKLIGEQIGQVISIDNSEAYRSKLFGPRIRLLVRDINRLPQTVVIPRLDGEGTVEYHLEYSGLPHQCGRCRGHDHLVRNCPRKFPPVRKKEVPARTKVVEPRDEQIKTPKLSDSQEDNSAFLAVPVQEHTNNQEAPPEVSNNSPPTYTGTQDEHQKQEPVNKTPVLRAGASGDEQSLASNIMEATETLTAQEKTHVPVGPEIKINPLHPDDINFPKLPSPAAAPRRNTLHQEQDESPQKQEPQFIWKSQHAAMAASKPQEGGKGKDKPLDSTPLTRQGYRTGRLADDFWLALGMPNTPVTNHKVLRVIPFLTKNRHLEQAEYLVDRRGKSFGAIAYVQISEVLAGIPWTQCRARQHIVNEVSQALHKILVFNNNLSNPFQKWTQGNWYAQWGSGAEGEATCTLYVSIDVPEQKVKPRKGYHMGWRKEPVAISEMRNGSTTEEIHPVAPDHTLWQLMAGKLPSKKATEQAPPESHNRFATLLEDEVTSDR